MSKRIIRNRRARYGGMSVLLTALLITVVVLFNSLFTTLAERYSWYASLNRTPEYPVTESCYTLLGTVLDGTEEKVEIIFCDTEKNLQADATMRYVYENAKDISQRFSDKVSISCHNIWLNPKSVEQYTYVRSSTIVDTTVEDETDAENAEEGSDNEGAAAEDSTEDELVKVALKSTNVIIASGDYHRVYDLTEFFVFENGDTRKQLLARSRYLLFKSAEKWTKSQKIRAKILFNHYPDIETAYNLTHRLRMIYAKSKSKGTALPKLALWYNDVEKAGYESFKAIAETIQANYDQILNFFNNRSTNASAESFNAKIKSFRAQLRGVSDVKYFLFRLTKIYA